MVSSFSEKPHRRRSLLPAEEEEEKEEEEEAKNIVSSSTFDDRHNFPSFRVYYAVTAGSVPFVWESEPGTPKRPAADFDHRILELPPLTPPPSYYSANTKSNEKSHNKLSLFKALLPKLLGRKKPPAGPNRRARFASPESSFAGSSRGGDDDAEYSGCDGSRTSTQCAWYVATPGRWWG